MKEVIKDLIEESNETEDMKISKKLLTIINDRMECLRNENAEEEPPDPLLLPTTKVQSSLKKKKLPEDFIEPNLNRTLPTGRKTKKLSNMTREEKLQRNHFHIFMKKRLPELKEESPGLRGYRAVQIITKEWLKL